MKKNYIAPSMEITNVKMQLLLEGSNGVYSDSGIKYGGVDEEGTKEPSSRRRNIWDDDEEDF
jgi:hypothetical protein